jgi:hypothetical protein
MSSADGIIILYGAGLAVVNIAYAAVALRRPQATADANRAFIESGKESYFEQRRAWKAYGTTPETDPNRVQRRAIQVVTINLLLIATVAPVEWLL